MIDILIISVIEAAFWVLAITGYAILAWKMGRNRRRIFRGAGAVFKLVLGKR